VEDIVRLGGTYYVLLPVGSEEGEDRSENLREKTLVE